jgi:hypothetical protein
MPAPFYLCPAPYTEDASTAQMVAGFTTQLQCIIWHQGANPPLPAKYRRRARRALVSLASK